MSLFLVLPLVFPAQNKYYYHTQHSIDDFQQVEKAVLLNWTAPNLVRGLFDTGEPHGNDVLAPLLKSVD